MSLFLASGSSVQKASLDGPSLLLGAAGTQRDHPGWGPSLLFITAGTQRATLSGVFLYLSAASANVWRERGYSDGCTLCLTQQYCLASMAVQFPPRAFPAVISSLTSRWAIFLQSKAILVLGFLSSPYAPASSHCVYWGTCIPVCST